MLALVPERTRLSPTLYDQVVSFFEAGPVFCGVDPSLKSFHRGSPNEAGNNPASGVAIEHGDLFSHADGVVDSYYVPQDGNLHF